MSIQFELTANDYVRYALWKQRTFPSIIFPILGALIMAVTFSGTLYTLQTPLWLTISGGFFGVILFAICLIWYTTYQTKRDYKKRLHRLGKMEIIVEEEGLKEITQQKVEYYPWNELKGYKQTKEYTYIFLQDYRSLLVTPIPQFVLEEQAHVKHRTALIIPHHSIPTQYENEWRSTLKKIAIK